MHAYMNTYIRRYIRAHVRIGLHRCIQHTCISIAACVLLHNYRPSCSALHLLPTRFFFFEKIVDDIGHVHHLAPSLLVLYLRRFWSAVFVMFIKTACVVGYLVARQQSALEDCPEGCGIPICVNGARHSRRCTLYGMRLIKSIESGI